MSNAKYPTEWLVRKNAEEPDVDIGAASPGAFEAPHQCAWPDCNCPGDGDHQCAAERFSARPMTDTKWKTLSPEAQALILSMKPPEPTLEQRKAQAEALQRLAGIRLAAPQKPDKPEFGLEEPGRG